MKYEIIYTPLDVCLRSLDPFPQNQNPAIPRASFQRFSDGKQRNLEGNFTHFLKCRKTMGIFSSVHGKFADLINKLFEKHCHNIYFGKSLIFSYVHKFWHELNFSLSAIKAFVVPIFCQRLYVLCAFLKKAFMCLLGHVLIKKM